MFHGWRIVAVAGLSQAFSAGATFYVFGVLLKPLAEDFDVSRFAATMGITLLILVQGCMGPFMGQLLDRWSTRGTMAIGVSLLSVGLFALSRATEFWQVALAFSSLMAIGAQMFGPVATATLAARWFVARRGRALGAVSLGSTFGGFGFPPLAAWLVAEFGWRGAATALSGLVALLLIPILLLVVDRPEVRGLFPDGAAVPPEAEPEAPSGGDAGALLRSPNLWFITAAVGLAWAPVAVVLTHFVSYATDLGVEPDAAAWLLSVYALTSAFGRVGAGFAADRIDPRVGMRLVVALLALGWVFMLGSPDYARLLVAACVMGVAVGGVMPLWGTITGATFGRDAFGRAMGLMNFPMLPFNLLGAPIAAAIHDRTGSYEPALLLCLVPMALSIVVVGFVRIPTRGDVRAASG